MSRSDYASRYVKKRKRSIVTEVGVFSVGFGVVLIALAIAGFCITSKEPEQLFGMPRGQVFASVLALLGIVCIVPGVLLLAMRSKGLVCACIVCASIPAVAYLGLAASFGLAQRDIIGTAIFIAVPVMLIIRGIKAMEEIDKQASQGDSEE